MTVAWRNSSDRYGAVAQLFHWIIVALLIGQFVLANVAANASLLRKVALLNWHKWFGMTILMLAVLRLLFRLTQTAPTMPANMNRWQRSGASLSHVTLYALLFAMPLTGWLMSSARNFPVSWFGLFSFPDLVQPNTALYERFQQSHDVLSWVLLAVTALHVLAALKHHFYDRDNILRRMSPISRARMDAEG